MNEVQFEAFKEFIYKLKNEILTLENYETIFIELGGTDIFSYQGSDKWVMYTMCHNIVPRDGSPKLEFYLDSYKIVCYTHCGNMDIIELVKKKFELLDKKKSNIQAVKWICELCGIKFDFSVKESDNNTYNWKSKFGKYLRNRGVEEVVELNVYDDSVLEYFEDKYYYEWIEEGIPEHVLEKYEIKWYGYRNQILIPCRSQKGDLIGIRCRNLDEYYIKVYGKYIPFRLLNGDQFNFPTNQVFFGEYQNSETIKRTKTCMLLESEKAVMKADVYLGEGNNYCLGLYGHTMSKEKVKILVELGVNTLILGYDSDFKEISYSQEGEEKTEYEKFEEIVLKTYKLCKSYFEVYVLYNNQGFKDCYKYSPMDYTQEQFNILMKNKERVTL